MTKEAAKRDDRQVVVIGSGPSGAMAARELVRQGITVTMLESGQELPGGMLVRLMGRTVYRHAPEVILHGERHVATGDPKTQWWYNLSPGGLSNQWTGAVPRFAPQDFSEGERLDARYRWPIQYEDLAPYYERVERLLSITFAPPVAAGLPASHFDYERRLPRDWQRIAEFATCRGQGLAPMPLADGPPFLAVRRGTAFNSYSCLIAPLLRSAHFTLLNGAHALRLEYDGAERRVKAVHYHDRATQTEHRVACAAVVIAAGTLNSAKLLFDSSCNDFPQGLGNTYGVLGRYLHDHPREWWVIDLARALSRIHAPAYLTRSPYAESTPLLATSWTITGVPGLKEKLLNLAPGKTNTFAVQVFGTMIPLEKYYVRPDEQKDEFGLPRLDICIHYDPDVVANTIAARAHLATLFGEAGYAATIRDSAPQLRPGSSVHYGGTARMHDSPEYGMADAWSRLHTVPNVIIGDASAFTTGPEKNPTLTAMALAARAAERLAYDLKAN